MDSITSGNPRLISVFVGIAIGSHSEPKRENPVEHARKWVDHFGGLTVERARAELGQPTAEKQWNSNSVSGPLLVYEFTPEAELQLFAPSGEVKTALLTVESK